MRWKKNLGWYLLFVLPLAFIFVTVVIIPFIIGVIYSFFKWDGLLLNPMTFVGFGNYKKLFSDIHFLNSTRNTVIFTILAVVLINFLGLIFALVVTTKLKIRNLARTMVFMPYLIGGLILGYMWKFIFAEVFKTLGESAGLTGIFFNWLLDPKFALLALVVVITWRFAGYNMIIYITGIQAIPEDMVEAAKVDGSGFWQTLFRIKFPLMMPAFTICLFMSLSSCFKIYDTNISLTAGGPNRATELFAMNIYNEIFSLNNYGYGQAKAIIFFFVVALITLMQVSITKKREVEM